MINNNEPQKNITSCLNDMPSKKEMVLNGIYQFGMHLGRIAEEGIGVYLALRVSGSEPKQAIEQTMLYSMLRLMVDTFDAQYFKQGRMYDRVQKIVNK